MKSNQANYPKKRYPHLSYIASEECYKFIEFLEKRNDYVSISLLMNMLAASLVSKSYKDEFTQCLLSGGFVNLLSDRESAEFYDSFSLIKYQLLDDSFKSFTLKHIDDDTVIKNDNLLSKTRKALSKKFNITLVAEH